MNTQRLLWLVTWITAVLLIPAAVQGEAVVSSRIVKIAPGTSRAEVQRALPAGSTVVRWLPEINAVVINLPAAARAETLVGPAIREVRTSARVDLQGMGPGLLVAQQYGLNRVAAFGAWQRAMGDGVTVAVIDTGILLEHPDLAANLWTNPGEIPHNQLDDDNNGYVDDMHGWHFYHDLNGMPQSDADLSDLYGHGTHVSGIVAADHDNSEGGTGVAPHAKIMTLRVFQSPTYPSHLDGQESDVAAAILYAVAQGASVINLSLGGTEPTPTLHDAIIYAVEHDVVVVAAAGNGYAPPVFYPGRYPEVITVGASTTSDGRASFSSFGPEVDLAAPGQGILSTAAPSASSSSCGGSGSYYTFCSGTSMATPFVSGAVALVRQVHPTYSPAEIKQLLQTTADDVDAPGYDEQTGWGRINLACAVNYRNGSCYTVYTPILLH